jgi:hypothetical protein
MKPNVDKLKKVLYEFDNERRKLQDLIYELEDVPKMKSLVGKYFKYKNAYNNTENWWLYYYVKKYKDRKIIVDHFQEDTRTKVEFEYDDEMYGFSFSSPSYIEITKEEYETAAQELLSKLQKKFKIK